jgi:hypothetical protein
MSASSGAAAVRGLHSSTFRLEVSIFCGSRQVYCVVEMTQTTQVSLKSGRVSAPARGVRGVAQGGAKRGQVLRHRAQRSIVPGPNPEPHKS